MGRVILLLAMTVFPVFGFGQTGILQWTDAHSTLETFTRQMAAIDSVAQDYYQRNPQGEFIIHVIGDFTSITPLSSEDAGWSFFRGLRLLKERGHRVIFTPGNHDAFDWSVKVDGAKLFEEQMLFLHQTGIEVVVGNLKGVNPQLSEVIKPFVKLENFEAPTFLFGLTLPNLMTKSNLNENSARTIFSGLMSYEESIEMILAESKKLGAENIILGVHDGHVRLEKKVTDLKQSMAEKDLSIKIPLAMGAHDHQSVSRVQGGTHFSNSGSHGSFSFIELSPQAEVKPERLVHIRFQQATGREMDWSLFEVGEVVENDITQADIKEVSWLNEFDRELSEMISERKKVLLQELAHLTFSIPEDKMDMKKGVTRLGTLIADSMVQWGESLKSLEQKDIPVLAMTNSSSYKLEESIEEGPLTEMTLRQMYPFLNEASLHLLDGHSIEILFLSLRQFYSQSNPELYSPQISSLLRESETGGLQVRSRNGLWENIDPNREYFLVIDGWLSDHRFGQSYRIDSWLEIFQNHEPLAQLSHQEILVREFPGVITAHQQEINPKTLTCRRVF